MAGSTGLEPAASAVTGEHRSLRIRHLRSTLGVNRPERAKENPDFQQHLAQFTPTIFTTHATPPDRSGVPCILASVQYFQRCIHSPLAASTARTAVATFMVSMPDRRTG